MAIVLILWGAGEREGGGKGGGAMIAGGLNSVAQQGMWLDTWEETMGGKQLEEWMVPASIDCCGWHNLICRSKVCV